MNRMPIRQCDGDRRKIEVRELLVVAHADHSDAVAVGLRDIEDLAFGVPDDRNRGRVSVADLMQLVQRLALVDRALRHERRAVALRRAQDGHGRSLRPHPVGVRCGHIEAVGLVALGGADSGQLPAVVVRRIPELVLGDAPVADQDLLSIAADRDAVREVAHRNLPDDLHRGSVDDGDAVVAVARDV